MRFEGKSRLGFFPLPLSEAHLIRSFLQFPDTPSSAIDPCVGDGVAFEVITSDAEVVRYGIELDAYRAEQARQHIPTMPPSEQIYTPECSKIGSHLSSASVILRSGEVSPEEGTVVLATLSSPRHLHPAALGSALKAIGGLLELSNTLDPWRRS